MDAEEQQLTNKLKATIKEYEFNTGRSVNVISTVTMAVRMGPKVPSCKACNTPLKLRKIGLTGSKPSPAYQPSYFCLNLQCSRSMVLVVNPQDLIPSVDPCDDDDPRRYVVSAG